MYNNLYTVRKNKILIIYINRPKHLNALNADTLLELKQVFLNIDNKEFNSIIITGDGRKSFIAGADITELEKLSPSQALVFSQLGHEVFNLIEQTEIPVVAAINGYALGGGLELSLACDFIYSNKNAKLGLVEIKLGIIPGFGGITRLKNRIGVARAKEMIFMGKQIDAVEGMRIGLVNKIADDDVLNFTVEQLEQLQLCAPLGIIKIKKLFNNTDSINISTSNYLEQLSFAMMFNTKDQKEGIESFLEKRKPIFKGV